MTSKTKTDIKSFFQTSDTPSEAQFIDLIDSYVDKSGPLGVLETAVSGGSAGFVYASAADADIIDATTALSRLGATVVTTAAVSAAVFNNMVATTAQANAGTATGVLMDPVLTKNALVALGASTLVLLGTANASSSTSLNFTSLITSSYNQYLLVIKDLLTSGTSSVGLKASTNNGSTYAITLSSLKEEMQLGVAAAPAYTAVSGTTPAPLIDSYTTRKYSGHIIMDIPALGFVCESYIAQITGGFAANTHISSTDSLNVNAVQLLPSSGDFTSGTVYLYGVKNT